ncbi:RNA pseudouridine synthase [Rhodoferax sp.]|uniref:RNA pseudouridine synthase n=1 Tax=Rhodoferax sp. TaxID=50421 RepID=UPI000AD37561|nr:RNA pseudouridine synthase [Rhodoferax sp.]
MSSSDSKPPRPTLTKPVKPPRAVVAPAPVAPRPHPAAHPAPAPRGQATAYRPGPATAPPPPAPSTKKPRFRKPRKEPVVEAPVVETGERLSKHVMALKDCSRKEAEQYIEGGWVRVNGVVVEEPAHRANRESVTVDADASLLNLTSVTLLLNKPAGYSDGTEEVEPVRGRKPPPDARSLLNAQTHWAHDPTETPVLKRHFNHLEADIELENGASGLVVFTQDWRTTRKLTEDMGTMEHEFLVEVKGEVAPEALKPIGYALKDERLDLPSVKVSVSSSTPEMSRLRFAIKGSHPGLVAYLCAEAKLEILAMRRIRLGRVTIADLPVGQWRFLAGYEKF